MFAFGSFPERDARRRRQQRKSIIALVVRCSAKLEIDGHGVDTRMITLQSCTKYESCPTAQSPIPGGLNHFPSEALEGDSRSDATPQFVEIPGIRSGALLRCKSKCVRIICFRACLNTSPLLTP